MKNLFLLIPILGMILAGCSNDNLVDDAPAGGNNVVDIPGTATRNFLTVSVLPTNGMGTRADEIYEDGDGSESNVTAVRFFFFDENGEAAPVIENRGNGTYSSYIDWYPNSSNITSPDEKDKKIESNGGNKVEDSNGNKTVEKILHTTLGILTPAGYENPAYVIAVINPTAEILALTEKDNNIKVSDDENVEKEIPLIGPSYKTLCAQTADYLKGLHDKNFVMSNSVYVDGTNLVVDKTSITDDNFKQSIEDAEKYPITIYVERVLARMDFAIDGTKMKGNEVEIQDEGKVTIYPTKENGTYNVDDKNMDIYVRFLRWNVTGTANESRLIKSVNSAWTDNNVFQNSVKWNTADYHRSFWAINPNGLTHQYGDFDGPSDNKDNINPANLPIKVVTASSSEYSTTYLQENANAYYDAKTTETSDNNHAAAPEYITKVIIAAQLCDEAGKPIELAEWGYRKYTVENMKKFFANSVLESLYFKTDGTTGTVYDKILPGDIDFKTAKQLDPNTEYGVADDEKDFYVYAVLSATEKMGTNKIWYLKGTDDNYTELETQAVNKYIYDRIRNVRVWNGGRTYYYFDVKHLGDAGSPGYCGIVRNHIYRTKVTSVQGLGTPVYNPDQIIIPEDNEYDESIVTADVKILQWRVVESDYELKWK